MRINNISSVVTNSILQKKAEVLPEEGITFQANKTKVLMGAGSALAASALFAFSQADGVKSSVAVEEYYKSNNNLKNEEIDLDRFSEQDKYEIMNNIDEIEINPFIFNKIAGVKLNKTEYRFDVDETISLFLESCKNIEKYPYVFERILSASDNEGNPRFSTNDCIALMREAKYIAKYPIAFNIIADAKEDDGTPRFDGQECAEILSKKGAIIKSILPEANTILNNPDYEIQDIIKLLDKFKKAEDEAQRVKIDLKELEKRIQASKHADSMLVLDSGEIIEGEKLAKILENRAFKPKEVKNLITLKNKNGTPRLTEKELCELLFETNPLAINDMAALYNYLTIANDDGTPFFTNEQCIEILLNSGDRGARIAEELFDIKKTDGSMRFTADEYVKFLTNETVKEKIAKNQDVFIAAATLFDSEGKSLYPAWECVKICGDLESYPDVFENLVALKNKRHYLNFEPQNIIDLGIDLNDAYSFANRNVLIGLFQLKDKYGFDMKDAKPVIAFAKRNTNLLQHLYPKQMTKFLEANLVNGKFNIENMKKYVLDIDKMTNSDQRFQSIIETKNKYGITPDYVMKMLIAN